MKQKNLLLLGVVVLYTLQMVGQVTMEVNVPEPGKLKSQISGGDAKKIECLVVTGVGLDAKDLIFIQKMVSVSALTPCSSSDKFLPLHTHF